MRAYFGSFEEYSRLLFSLLAGISTVLRLFPRWFTLRLRHGVLYLVDRLPSRYVLKLPVCVSSGVCRRAGHVCAEPRVCVVHSITPLPMFLRTEIVYIQCGTSTSQ